MFQEFARQRHNEHRAPKLKSTKSIFARACVNAFVRACAHARVKCACVCVCVCVRARWISVHAEARSETDKWTTSLE